MGIAEGSPSPNEKRARRRILQRTRLFRIQCRLECVGKVANPHPITALNAFVGLGGFRLDVWSAIDMTEYNRPDGGSRAYKNNREYRAEMASRFRP